MEQKTQKIVNSRHFIVRQTLKKWMRYNVLGGKKTTLLSKDEYHEVACD